MTTSQRAGEYMRRWRRIARAVVGGAALLALASAALAATVQQQTFATPEAGVEALVAAVKTGDDAALRALFGQNESRLLSSGDPAADARYRASFSQAYTEGNRLLFEGATQATLLVGSDEWPLPIPLVKTAAGWRFDSIRGESEILKRHIGRNELGAMRVCAAIVDAEREYAAQHLDADGVPVYAPRLVSSEHKQDGLYWPTAANATPSPLGRLLAAAADDGNPNADTVHREPYYGYYYRILTAQGSAAPDGARDYFIKGKLIGGFAVLAYPAHYGASGITSFMVDSDGDIYENDLGPQTQSIVTFNPAPGWKLSAPVDAPNH